MNSPGVPFQVRLKILTPVHIGSGETINRLDYFIKGDYCYRVNIDSLFNDTAFQPIKDKFLESAPSGQPIDKLVPKSLLEKHIRYKIHLHNSARNTNLIEFRLFIKSAGRVYIPGSSLKGAILSALCYEKLKECDKNNLLRVLEGEVKSEKQGRQRREYQDPLDLVLPRLGGRTGEKTDKFTHWLDVSDSELHLPEESLELVQAVVVGARRGGRIPILYEALKPDTQFTFTLKLDPASQFTPDSLLNSVNRFYQQVFTKDRRLQDIKIPATKTLIRLGQGSGMFATSLLLLAQELNLTERYRLPRIDTRIGPRTRKRVKENIPLGWVEMEVIK